MLKVTKILFSILISLLMLSAKNIQTEDVTLYLPHSETHKLIAEKHTIIYDTNLADAIFDALKKKSYSSEYLSLFHDSSYAFTDKSTATVDILPLKNTIENKLNAEYLTIYSIVNSLTSTGEIITVKFTQDGIFKKDFYGYTDMREVFIPDYDICS